jgi:glutaredoxin
MVPRLLGVLLLLCAVLAPQGVCAEETPWVTGAGSADARVHLYFFWSRTCPHCRDARPFVEALDRNNPWLTVHAYELTQSREHIALYVEMARAQGQEARAVPAFFVCDEMLTGYDDAGGVGARLRRLATSCRPDHMDAPPAPRLGADAPTDSASEPSSMSMAEQATETAASVTDGEPGTGRLQVPVLGELDAESMSLPLFTLVIAGLDAFNPCAFFVLLFLLSLMVHARSRARMLLVGGTFVFFSGLVYFLFMAAWLNLFLVVGGAPIVTLIAGLVAVLIGVLNVKDFFLFKHRPEPVDPRAGQAVGCSAACAACSAPRTSRPCCSAP